jgi:hypothetical protein
LEALAEFGQKQPWMTRMKPQLRIRVSTVLLCAGLLLLPWSSTLLATPKLPPSLDGIQHFLNGMILDVGPLLFFVAFFIASGLLVAAIWRRQWACASQSMAEMSACVLAFSAVPAY